MGVYQEGIAKDSVGGKDVTAHIFEYTTSAIVTSTGEVSQGPCPVQILFCLKEQNKKKLNSHRWFFNAFGPLIKPNGTRVSRVFSERVLPHIFSLCASGCRNKADRDFHL